MVPAAVQAQGPSAEELAQARALFEQGLEAARAERWDEARELFERSLAAAPVPTTRFNLAGAEVRSGRLLQGARSYRTFLSEATTGRATRYRAEAQQALAEVEARLAHVAVVADGLEPNDRVTLDGEEIGGVADEELEASPGDHVVAIVRGGREVARERFTLAERERRTVTLVPSVLAPEPSAQPLPEVQPPAEEGSSFLSYSLYWGGAAALVVAVIVVVLVASSGGDDPFRGNLGAGMGTFE